METIHQRVQSQLGAAANAYTVSVGHSDPALLQVVVELAKPRPDGKLFRAATPALVEALRIECRGDEIRFCVPQVAIGAVKPAVSVGRLSPKLPTA
jgi:hypothetical protein